MKPKKDYERTRYRGVSKTASGKYEAILSQRIQLPNGRFSGKNIYLGRYSTELEAAQAVANAGRGIKPRPLGLGATVLP